MLYIPIWSDLGLELTTFYYWLTCLLFSSVIDLFSFNFILVMLVNIGKLIIVSKNFKLSQILKYLSE